MKQLRRRIRNGKGGSGAITNTDFPGGPGTRLECLLRMVNEVAADDRDLNFNELLSHTADAMMVYKSAIDKTRQYDLIDA